MNLPVLCFDEETYLELFLIKFYNPSKDEWSEFKVSRWENQLDGLFKFLDSYKDHYLVGYNSLPFDAQVLEWIYRNYERWHELSGLEICQRICQKAQDTIDNSNYEIFPEYRESELSFRHIDLMKVSHFDNKTRRVSLKRLMFEMDMELIEELPIPFDKKDLTPEDVEIICNYGGNDVYATYKFWKFMIGEVEHPLYKENNQIQLRMDIQEEFGIPCMNYSNAKIGDEIIKKYYCEEKGITYNQLPKKGFFRKQIELKYCIPKHISFKTKELKEFLKETKTKILKRDEDFTHTIKFYGQEYTFGKGGLHNVINGKIFTSDEENDLIDIDVSGFYPAIIINNSYYPYHLGKEFLVGYKKPYFKRIDLKPLSKKDKRIKGIVSGLKEAGNCPYGKSSDMQSWLYDKQMTLSTCLTGEFSLLMLIEECELNGIRCIMANTDGATFIVPKVKYEQFSSIKKEWVEKTTANLSYELEEVKYEKMVFSTVNDYIAIKANDDSSERVKLRGDFMKDFDLHKNHSARICPIALEKYYVDGIPVEETIKNHKNIYDFAIRQKATKDFHYEGHSITKTKKDYLTPTTRNELIASKWEPTSTGWIHKNLPEYTYLTFEEALKTENEWRKKPIETISKKSVYNKLIRYYISNTGEKLFKIKNPSCKTNAAAISQVEAGEWVCHVCNKLEKDHSTTNVNFNYYIEKCNRIINKIKLEGKKPIKKSPPNQISLFG